MVGGRSGDHGLGAQRGCQKSLVGLQNGVAEHQLVATGQRVHTDSYKNFIAKTAVV